MSEMITIANRYKIDFSSWNPSKSRPEGSIER
jgi:hypothetical protein